MGIFAEISGLKLLAERFSIKEAPDGETLAGQTVQIGPVRYRKCVTVIIGTNGLYLKVAPPLSHSSKVLIPWDEIKRTSPATLYGRNASMLSLDHKGEQRLTVYNELFELIKPNLGQDP